jgi:hypothetical protein
MYALRMWAIPSKVVKMTSQLNTLTADRSTIKSDGHAITSNENVL